MSEPVTVRTIGGPHPGSWRLRLPWPPPYTLEEPGGAGRYVRISQSRRDGMTASYQWVTTRQEERCKHELPLSQCADCSRKPAARPGWEALHDRSVAEAGKGPWITSRYDGRCAGCGYRWEPGEQIRASDDEGGWVCETCGSAG